MHRMGCAGHAGVNRGVAAPGGGIVRPMRRILWPAAGLVGPVWKLTRYEAPGQPPATVPSPEKFTAQFGEGRVAVLADCNRCSAGYSSTDSKLSVGLMACTMAACPSAPLDTQYAGALQSAQSYTITGSDLVVISERGRLTFQR